MFTILRRNLLNESLFTNCAQQCHALVDFTCTGLAGKQVGSLEITMLQLQCVSYKCIKYLHGIRFN